jgi:hypothetical protein
MFTADVRTGQFQFVAEEIAQQKPGLDGPLKFPSIDTEVD